MKGITVSICCLAYNHERYIRQCLEGFVMQKCTFNFEILIHDDASTDNTASIIREYETAYPNLIKPIYQAVNQYSKGVSPTITYNFPRVKGKYIALCEGDDYWTDPLKLQKQVDFLESNSNYVLSCHNAIIVDSLNNKVRESKLSVHYQRDFTNEELILTTNVLTLSMCFKNVLKEFPIEIEKTVNGDRFLISMLGLYGAAKYQSEIEPAVYRLHNASIWSSKSKSKQDDAHRTTFYNIYKYHKKIKTKRALVNQLFARYYSFTSKTLEHSFSGNRFLKGFLLYINFMFQCIVFLKFKFNYFITKKLIKCLLDLKMNKKFDV